MSYLQRTGRTRNANHGIEHEYIDDCGGRFWREDRHKGAACISGLVVESADSRAHSLSTVPIWSPTKHEFNFSWWTPERRAAQAERLSWEDETNGNGHG